MARPPQGLLDPRIGANIPDGRDDKGQALALQGAQRDLDHDLAAVAAPGDELHLRTHGPCPRRLAIGFTVGRMARADAVGHQGIHAQADEGLRRVAQQHRGSRIGQRDVAVRVHQQQGIGAGREQRAVNRWIVRRLRQRGWRHAGRLHQQTGPTGGTKM